MKTVSTRGGHLGADRLAWLGLTALSVLGACDLGSPVVTVDPGTISGTISYDGTASGPLVVEAFATFPPGEPLASMRIAAPRFPQRYELRGLSPGEIFLAARLLGEDGVDLAIGTFPSVQQVSPVVLGEEEGLRGADFEVFDEGSRPEGPIVPNGTRTLSGTIQFDGTVQQGDWLRGALYRTYPPNGPPADLMILNVRDPVFPYSFRFSEVRDGNYYTVFYLDRHGDSPFGPGVDDRVAWALEPGGSPRVTTIALGAGQGGVDIAISALPPR